MTRAPLTSEFVTPSCTSKFVVFGTKLSPDPIRRVPSLADPMKQAVFAEDGASRCALLCRPSQFLDTILGRRETELERTTGPEPAWLSRFLYGIVVDIGAKKKNYSNNY